jgi:hypothetical protein
MNGPSPTSALRPLYLELRISIGRVLIIVAAASVSPGRVPSGPPIFHVLASHWTGKKKPGCYARLVMAGRAPAHDNAKSHGTRPKAQPQILGVIKIREHLGASGYLCRMLAFTLKSRRPGNICGEGACINRKRRTKPVEESGSMWLLAK